MCSPAGSTACAARNCSKGIVKRYRQEPEFRSDVDRYIKDFERLLDTVSENDRDNTMVDSYLSSETGKVYLMLAHASGRIN